MKFNFHFGNKRPDRNQLMILFIVVSVILSGLSKCSGTHKNSLWDLLHEIQRKFFPQGQINELIIKYPEKLQRRIERDVTKAIDKVTPEYTRIIQEADKKFESKYVDEVNDESVCYTNECKALAPPMRICSSVVEGIDCN